MNTDTNTIGLCATCIHARAIAHPRGGDAYWQCARAAVDPRFPRYPRLPVVRCVGYEEGTNQ
ncbi:MAG: hypothetical protein IT368_12125 [Candidatus Hydrogenedentes bacterium]|nr:hypothetical protein [Candidatus Hydrogenedentota bacterium]